MIFFFFLILWKKRKNFKNDRCFVEKKLKPLHKYRPAKTGTTFNIKLVHGRLQNRTFWNISNLCLWRNLVGLCISFKSE